MPNHKRSHSTGQHGNKKPLTRTPSHDSFFTTEKNPTLQPPQHKTGMRPQEKEADLESQIQNFNPNNNNNKNG